MEISETLRSLFNAPITTKNGEYVFELPANEIVQGPLEPGEMVRVAILSANQDAEGESSQKHRDDGRASAGPPVEEGDVLEVEIEDVGDQGDGIARIKGGYVVIVADTKTGDMVTVEITDVAGTYAFAEVV